MDSIGVERDVSYDREELQSEIEIVDVNSWRMEAVVANSFHDKTSGRVFLAGDSAHAFPPSGGFGLNTGIGDAFNLAHKLAVPLNHADKSIAEAYTKERRLVSKQTKDFALINYEKSLTIAKKLNLHASHASLFTNVLDQITTPLGLSGSATQKSILQSSMKTGLSILQMTASTDRLGRFLTQDKGNSIRLLFPSLDFGYKYESEESELLYEYFDTGVERLVMDERHPGMCDVGELVPHIRIVKSEGVAAEVKSLRQFLTKKSYTEGKSLRFVVEMGESNGEEQ